MPNHVHLIIDLSAQLVDSAGKFLEDVPPDYLQLWKILKRIKGSSARSINLFLKKEGSVWQKDSFDRLIRNEKEFYKYIYYILENPVKANLANHWEDYPHNYLSPNLKKEIM